MLRRRFVIDLYNYGSAIYDVFVETFFLNQIHTYDIKRR